MVENVLLLDASGEESACGVSTVTIGVAPDGDVCGMWKHGEGDLGATEMLHSLKVFTGYTVTTISVLYI